MVVWTRCVDRRIKPSVPWCDNRSKPMVLNVGRVSAEKGLASLVELDPNEYTLVIVGDGPYMSRARELLPWAQFVGYKSGQELVDYYNQADVFVFPSQADTFGLVIIEAMAQGCPVAAFPVQGPVDIIENGVNGYMDWDLESAVRQCLTLNRDQVKLSSQCWTWEICWSIFRNNLVQLN